MPASQHVNARCALYLRSSKDRHDVSIDVQRNALKQLAAQRDLTVVEEFADAVESGKDEDRPGFLRLIAAVRNDRRGWSTLLVLDTSRLARRRLLALMFEERECARHAVRIIYKALPESLDPGMEVILKSQLQAMDEWHSITSRQKGLAGMAQNVKDGFRAGGRAPLGYRLTHIPTGAIREGVPVTKARLEPSEHAASVTAYLHARAAGTARRTAAAESGLTATQSTLVGMEWNALTYAGHTVWNVHAARHGGHSVTGHKRRPRSEWQIQRDTHPAFITDGEAEAILASLARYTASRPRRTSGKYLLTGILRTPAGARYYGEAASDCYRVRGRYVRRATLEHAVVGKVMQDLLAPRFVDALVAGARATVHNNPERQHIRALRERVGDIAAKIGRLVELATELAAPGPALRKIDELERERTAALTALEQAEASQSQYAALTGIDAVSVRKALASLAHTLDDAERDSLKAALASMIDRIDLDPATLACAIHYAIPGNAGLGMDRAGIETRSRGDASAVAAPGRVASTMCDPAGASRQPRKLRLQRNNAER